MVVESKNAMKCIIYYEKVCHVWAKHFWNQGLVRNKYWILFSKYDASICIIIFIIFCTVYHFRDFFLIQCNQFWRYCWHLFVLRFRSLIFPGTRFSRTDWWAAESSTLKWVKPLRFIHSNPLWETNKWGISGKHAVIYSSFPFLFTANAMLFHRLQNMH